MKLAFAFVTFALAAATVLLTVTQPAAKADTDNISAPVFRRADAFARSRPLREIPARKAVRPAVLPVETRGFDPQTTAVSPMISGDDKRSAAIIGNVPMPPPVLSFDGLSDADNVNAYGLLVFPPDANGDIGPQHYVQAVNSLVRVFDRNGNALTPPISLIDIFAPLGTACSQRIDGLTNVLYDPLADRWILTQICTDFPPFKQMIAISRDNDPTGDFYLYEYLMPNVNNPDFPKYGVWPDGYYLSTNEFFGADFVGSGAFAFDREKMLRGDPTAGYIYFFYPEAGPARRGGLLPSDMDGLRPPPTGLPNAFAGYTATEYGAAADAMKLFDFHADFDEPELSTFTERLESPIAAAPFDPTSPEGRADIAQPLPGEFLDSQSDRPAARLAYRNFGEQGSLVFNMTVRASGSTETYRAGIRLYELRDDGSGYRIAEQATFDDGSTSRWIGSAAQDGVGNLAVGYNVASSSVKPSLRYSGRSSADPPGVFRAEQSLVEGTGVQTGFGFRWGEYSSMSVDPVDDCTFWMTGEYYTLESQQFSEFGWLTRIGTFRFPECVSVSPAKISGAVTNALTGASIENAVVKAAAYSRSTDANGDYGPMSVVAGSYQVRVSASGFLPKTVAVTVTEGETVTLDVQLTPAASITSETYQISSESCSPDGAPEPGEDIAIDLPLRNVGAAAVRDLYVLLRPGGSVIPAGGERNYGTMPAGGGTVVRNFSFRVSPDVPCGSMIELTFFLRDGPVRLGILRMQMRVGSPKFAYIESFDNAATPDLPEGWTTSAAGGQSPWATSAERSTSAANSMFSPDPIHVGVNEAVSPEIAIETPHAELRFQNWYELESTFLRNRLYDGGVLEISAGGGEWQDILTAGGEFISGGYDGIIDGCCQNPLAGRPGWSGKSGTGSEPVFIDTRVKLPKAAAGNSIRLRWRVGTDIGTFREGQYIDDIQITDGFQCGCALGGGNNAPFDMDGDGRTDLSVYAFSDDANMADFRILKSSDGAAISHNWGSVGDVPAAADFDGDGRTDIAVFRPQNGTWYILNSSDSTATFMRFGTAGDVPVPARFHGKAAADIALFRPSDGRWYILEPASQNATIKHFGVAGDLPLPDDFDGDGTDDIAVFRPSSGTWYIERSSDGVVAQIRFGENGDRPVSGDLDGDGRSDITVFRPSNGTWYSLQGSAGLMVLPFGMAGDEPLQADIDRDGRRDIGVFRPSTAVWYFIASGDGGVRITSFGQNGDHALPGIYVR